jgi:cysteine desulfurase
MGTTKPQPIYLDHNATTPLLPEVADTMREAYTAPYLNPASQHQFGRRARRVLEDARERIGELVGAKMAGPDADRVLFTSGGTEANNLAVQGLASVHRFRTHDARPAHVIASTIEHPSVAAVADQLKLQGLQLDDLNVDANGTIRASDLPPILRPNTCLVVAMLANNETGVIQPIADLAAIATQHGIPLHTDACQAIGKFPVNFRQLGATSMSLAAHKFHGPLGIGALVIRQGIELAPQLFGGVQQGGLRPGTESVALALGMLRALELWYAETSDRTARLTKLRDEFERNILAGYPDAVIIGASVPRLPNTSNVAFVGFDRQALFIALDQAALACSTGSACASGSSEPSPVHVAMGLDSRVRTSALRFSFGATSTAAEVAEATRRILHICNDLRPRKEA